MPKEGVLRHGKLLLSEGTTEQGREQSGRVREFTGSVECEDRPVLLLVRRGSKHGLAEHCSECRQNTATVSKQRVRLQHPYGLVCDASLPEAACGHHMGSLSFSPNWHRQVDAETENSVKQQKD